MSFNTPFTTLSYYSWLFESDNLNSTDNAFVSIPSQSADISHGENSLTIPHGKGYYPGTDVQIQDGLHSTNLNSEISASPSATNNRSDIDQEHNHGHNGLLPTRRPISSLHAGDTSNPRQFYRMSRKHTSLLSHPVLENHNLHSTTYQSL